MLDAPFTKGEIINLSIGVLASLMTVVAFAGVLSACSDDTVANPVAVDAGVDASTKDSGGDATTDAGRDAAGDATGAPDSAAADSAQDETPAPEASVDVGDGAAEASTSDASSGD